MEWYDVSKYCWKYDHIGEHFTVKIGAGGLLAHVKQMPDAIRQLQKSTVGRVGKFRSADRNIKLWRMELLIRSARVWIIGYALFLAWCLELLQGRMSSHASGSVLYGQLRKRWMWSGDKNNTHRQLAWRNGIGFKSVSKIWDNSCCGFRCSNLNVAATLTEDGNYLTLSVINATHREYQLALDFITENIPAQEKAFVITGANDMVYIDQCTKTVFTSKKLLLSWSITAYRIARIRRESINSN